MKTWSAALLFTISLSLFSPFTPALSGRLDDGVRALATLDVCDGANHVLTSTADTAAAIESVEISTMPGLTGFLESSNPAISISLISFQRERPPRS